MKLSAKTISAVAAGAYLLHRVGRRSGATTDEVNGVLPGDDVVTNPMWQSTRAITIDALPEDVWPWIVQMGFPSHRAGWYTPHWLDRLTFGIKQPSANEIRPDLQKLVPGDRVPDSDDWSTYFTVVTVDPPHSLVLHSTRHIIKPIKKIDFSWAFVLRGFSGGKTRLFIRARANYTPTSAAWLIEFVIGPGDFVNAGVMLRGIKSRAECGSGSAPTTPPLNAWRRRPGDERPTSVTGRRTSAKRSLWWRWVAATAAAAAFAWARLPALRP